MNLVDVINAPYLAFKSSGSSRTCNYTKNQKTKHFINRNLHKSLIIPLTVFCATDNGIQVKAFFVLS